jgi:dethiobiotin synthetase
MIRLGVTGTDTGVGKTVVTCAIASALTRRGLRVAAMKPIETGCEFDDPNRDGARLWHASSETRDLAVVAPLTFPEPVAPILAAELAGVSIDQAFLDRAVDVAAHDRDALLVEGAGGILVPIADGLSFDNLFVRWSLDVIIVGPNRLGVLNHTRLTLAAARAAGLRIRAVVLNQIGQDGSDRSIGDNARLIASLENVPVVQLPRAPRVDDLEAAAELVERVGLIDLILA